MEWFVKHIDTIIILGAFASSVIWMNGKFSTIEKEIVSLDKEIAIVKTVVIMQNFMTKKLAINEEK